MNERELREWFKLLKAVEEECALQDAEERNRYHSLEEEDLDIMESMDY